MTTTPSFSAESAGTETVQLQPRYGFPIALILLAIPVLVIQPWLSGAIALFGLFLLFQAVTLRVYLTETALDLYRGETLLRRFPYQDWLSWRILWPRMPIWFYFREVNSIHSFPILFDPDLLKTTLEQRCPMAKS